MRNSTTYCFAPMLAVAMSLMACRCAPITQQSFQDAQRQCDQQYPLKMGTMAAQASCIHSALTKYGHADFGKDYAVAAKVVEARLILWGQADEGKISVSDAKMALSAYSAKVAENSDYNTDLRSLGDRTFNRIQARAQYND